MADEILLPGFVIGGFRSFHGPDPQYIGPLGKITAIVGHNNDGKSNILLAAKTCLPALKTESKSWPFSELDWPTGIDPRPPFISGIALPGGGTRLEALLRRLPASNAVPPGTNTHAALESMSTAEALRQPGVEDDLVWLRMLQVDNRFEPDPTQVAQLEEQTRNLVPLLNSQSSGQGGGNRQSLAGLLNSMMSLTFAPSAKLVPATRTISSNPQRQGPEEISLDGEGLPQLLQALQSPTAPRYVEDNARFEAVNVFVQEVLRRPDARILVPWDSETIHVKLGDRVLPLANLGTGISQVVLLATLATWYDRTLICLEEPELHLHPTLLRSLIRYLKESTTNQYLITTHSAHLLDDPAVTVLQTSYAADTGTTVTPSLSPKQRAELAVHLGYRASDLLQANSIIWVEGPSDRVYINHWIRKRDKSLQEGIHYSVMFYGGRLLAHVTGEQAEFPDSRTSEFIHLLSINRNMAIVVDSDKRDEPTGINETKQRIVAEFAEANGFAWVTSGREIENYVPPELLVDVTRGVHPQAAADHMIETGQYVDVFAGLNRPDKVRIAEGAVADAELWDVLDLRDRVDELVAFIRDANQFDTAATSSPTE